MNQKHKRYLISFARTFFSSFLGVLAVAFSNLESLPPAQVLDLVTAPAFVVGLAVSCISAGLKAIIETLQNINLDQNE